jgi:hypothetical protein
LGLHVPLVVESICPARAAPEMAGKTVFFGGLETATVWP